MAGNDSTRAGGGPSEQPAVRTTIVGGRPPGAGKSVGDIPRGIEVLVKKASVDAGFRAALLERRAEAAGEIGLTLTPAEAAMLGAIPAAQLAAIISATKVDPQKTPAFLGKAAALMLAALGATNIACDPTTTSHGVRPADQANPPAVALPAITEADRQIAVEVPEGGTVIVAGLQAVSPASQPSTRPDQITRGVRPDYPPMSKGIRPDMPKADPESKE